MNLRFLLIAIFSMSVATPMASFAEDKPISDTVDLTNAEYGQFPDNYEDLVKEWASSNLKD